MRGYEEDARWVALKAQQVFNRGVFHRNLITGGCQLRLDSSRQVIVAVTQSRHDPDVARRRESAWTAASGRPAAAVRRGGIVDYHHLPAVGKLTPDAGVVGDSGVG